MGCVALVTGYKYIYIYIYIMSRMCGTLLRARATYCIGVVERTLWYRIAKPLTLNEKVGFKIPTTRYRKNSILCGALQIGTAKWTSGVRWSFGTSRVARGIKGS